jgi:hypothetical protein
MYKILLFIGLFISMSCSNNAGSIKETPISKETQDTPKETTVVELTIDELMQQIDAETADFTPSESDVTIQDINACNVKDYKGIKKYIFCFAGGMKAQEAVLYYKEGKAIAARYTLEAYNASPANLAEYDEAKTIKKQVKLYFKEGDLRAFDKVLDLNNQAVTLDEAQSKEWEILIAAI